MATLERTLAIAVIGGCGYLGKQIVKLIFEGRAEENFRDKDLEESEFVKLEKLSKRVHEVRIVDILVVNDGCEAMFNDIKLTQRRCDITDGEALEAVLSGCEVVIHCASILDATDSDPERDKCFNVNVNGTENVVKACLNLGISSLVYTSSVAAIGPNIERNPLKNIDTHEQEYNIDHPSYYVYGRSKREADKIVQEAHGRKLAIESAFGKTKLSTCVIRPGGMFGEEDAYFTRHVEMGNSSCLRTVLTVGNVVMTYSYVGNVAHLHLLAVDFLLSNKATEECLTLFAGDDCSPDYISKIQAYILCPIGYKVVGAPIGLFMFISNIVEAMYKLENRLFGSSRMLALRRKAGAAVVHSASTDVSFTYDKAHTLLGYNPIYSFENSLIRTQKWFLRFTDYAV